MPKYDCFFMFDICVRTACLLYIVSPGQSADRALRGGGAALPAPRALQSHCGSQAVQDSGAVAVDDFLDCFEALLRSELKK